MLRPCARKDVGFYSNSVRNPLQEGLARKLGEACGYEDWSLFLVNSGAEANENALKLASFHTGRDKVVAFHGAFHGRTSGAVAVTDNPKIQAPFNAHHKVAFATLNDLDSVEQELRGGDVAAVILEAIQGVGGIRIATDEFLQGLRTLCTKYGTVLIMDEVQCGYVCLFLHSSRPPKVCWAPPLAETIWPWRERMQCWTSSGKRTCWRM